MEDKEKKDEEENRKKPVQPFPFCTDAPSPEHARWTSDDEPCDDSRQGR
jgi:hypothetical protein